MPFYIAAPRTTLDTNLKTGQEIEIEQRDPKELTHHQGKQVAAPGINVILLPNQIFHDERSVTSVASHYNHENVFCLCQEISLSSPKFWGMTKHAN